MSDLIHSAFQLLTGAETTQTSVWTMCNNATISFVHFN